MDGLQILSVILGIAGITGGATGYFAKSRGDTVISLQGKEIEYWKDRAGQLEKDSAAHQAELDTLRTQNEGLIGRTQGSPQLTKLTKEVAELITLVKKQNGK